MLPLTLPPFKINHYCLSFLFLTQGISLVLAGSEIQLESSDFSTDFTIQLQATDSTEMVTWWFPEGATSFKLPIAAGVEVDPKNPAQIKWLLESRSWSLMELPVLGANYGDQTLIIIAPWPHYGKIVAGKSLGIRIELPPGRLDASPVEIVTVRRPATPLAAAHAFRDWRKSAKELGAIPPVRTLGQKISDLPKVERLLGAPHFYLWGSALFSDHDVPRNKWVGFAKALNNSPSSSFGDKLTQLFAPEQREQLKELSQSDWPAAYLTQGVADTINAALTDSSLLGLNETAHPTEVSGQNKAAFKSQFPHFLKPTDQWGDGFSKPLLDAISEAGIDRANLVLSDLYGYSAKPDVAAYAKELGFLIGPYDSYHSVHSPEAEPDDTWETAQFDKDAFEVGRVINFDGSGHGGFKGIGYHFSPQAAWPYVQDRVNGIVSQTNYSTWFIDCDATGECFDDYHASHSANRMDDSQLRRHRLNWIESSKGMVVGSEGGSIVFADVIHYGHGVNTPYIGHLSPAFKDKQSPHFLGRHWPPHQPEMYFKPIPVPPGLNAPYFDPVNRIPLYQAAVGDELVTTHHWNFDSLKFADIEHTRELIEILYMVPPMYHLNRAIWETRKEKILKHYTFWSPLHRKLAPAPLIDFEYLSDDRLIQRSTFLTPEGEVSITVNFGSQPQAGLTPFSVEVGGAISLSQMSYQALPNEG